MRILELVESSGGGVGRHVADLISALLDRGHEVHLVYSDLRSDTVFWEDLRWLGDRQGFRARRIQMRRGLHARDLLAARSLRRYLQTRGPFDVVHCHSTKAGLIGRLALVGSSLAGVYTPHGFFTMDKTRNVLARSSAAAVETALSRLGDIIIVVSRQEYEHALDLGIAPAVLRLVPNGVALDPAVVLPRGALRKAWGLHDGETCVGFVARMVPVKSPETMVAAFARLLQSPTAVPAKLVMIGDGPLAGACRRLAKQLAIDARVVWLGEQDAKTMMHAFDILVMTSESEAAGLVVLEGMARGLPVVATSVGIVPGAVREGVNGFIVPVRDATAIANSLRTLVNDSALRESMGRMSRVLAQEFSVDRMVERTLEVYREVAGGVRDGRPAREMTAAVGR